MITPIYKGFDGLDVTFQGRIPASLCEVLERAKVEAMEARRPTLVEWRGQSFHVAESGAKGGYAYRCDTGPEGAVWFFSRNQKADQWNIRVSARSAWLATKGFGRVRVEMYEFLEAIGADVMAEAIARVDYAVDVRAADLPGFVLDPTAFVMHSHTSRADHAEDIDIHGVSGRYTSVTVGKMPGRQIIVYDKTKEVAARQKAEWPVIWAASMEKQGMEPLAEGERVYRVEMRAGKAHLKERWGIATWADLDAKLGDLFALALADIRYCMPSADSNRARWAIHPLWAAVTEAVAGDLFEMTSGARPGVVKEVRRAALAQTMSAMILGLLASWSLATGADAREVPPAVQGMAESYIEQQPKDFRTKIDRAAKKYVFILEEEGNGSVDCQLSQDAGRGGAQPVAWHREGYCGGAVHPGHGDGTACPSGASGEGVPF
ncbi:hypothetical protein WV31_07465 [Magnetospirillum sp. ME-1]|uniref:hypothetical protein n=1 Tax=Magnetospirillum sp. ME-1 TaxID=1639348 RepID=UPI000A17D6A5|nr:hypothetical protein [Magnetospirillum sp. ME-1]ARJ65502.1 hypothetical protein WV31_07465 [Magnetospirillum sp. ME-1]